jgi:outer membrane protein OmpA-like peptidoglycan-associated protein
MAFALIRMMGWILLLFLCVFRLFSQVDKCHIVALGAFTNGDTLSLADARKLKELTIFNLCDSSLNQLVLGYQFTLTSPGKSPISLPGYGPVLTSKMITALNTAAVQSKIFIDNITAKTISKKLINVSGLTIYVGSASRSSRKIGVTLNSTKIPACKPIVRLGGHNAGSTVSKKELTIAQNLEIGNPCNIGKKYNGCSVDIYYKVISYQILVKSLATEVAFEASGSEFPESAKKYILSLKDSTELLIRQILAKYPDGSFADIPDVNFRITPYSRTLTLNIEESIESFIKSDRQFHVMPVIVQYAADSFSLTPKTKIELDRLAKVLKKYPNLKVEVYSHTDSRSDDTYNLKLSEKRSRSVVNFLVGKGVNKNKLTAYGKGESQLLNRCKNGVKCTEEEHAVNRRTEFHFIK